jgi:hypothetical protein
MRSLVLFLTKPLRLADLKQPATSSLSRFNGELRDREKVTRNLKIADSPILTGLQVYHNYIRPHMALEGKTSGEKAGLFIKG